MRWLCTLVLAATVIAACSDDGGSTPNPGALEAEIADSVPGSTTTTTLRPPPPTDPPEREDPTIGSLVIPCRPADATSLPDRPGVTSEVVTIGTGSDRGGIGTPGAGNGIVEMIEVLADFCNSRGGLHGRDLRVIEYDAAAFEAADRVEEACAEVVALVGHAFLQEIETALSAAACGLPLYTGGTDLTPTSPFALHGHLAAAFTDPGSAAEIVLVGPDTPLSAADRAARRQAIELAGGVISVVGEVAYPIDSIPDWETIAGQVRALGGGQVHIDGGCEQSVLPFVDVAERADWRPVIIATATAYDEACLSTLQPDRLLIELPFLPFEDGALAPATAAHGELLDQIGAPRTGSGLLAASEFWRWASSAEACLSDVDSACFAQARAGQAAWTAGGLHGAVEPDGSSEGCAVILGVEEGRFVRRLPTEPGTYDCSPERSVVLPTDS